MKIVGCDLHTRYQQLIGCWNKSQASTPSPPEQSLQIASPVYHAQNQHILILDAMDEQKLTDGEAAMAEAEVILARTSEIGKARCLPAADHRML